MNISKGKIDIYKLRDSKGNFPWADIAIDSGFTESSHGAQNWFRISISSDYGDWTYFWSHPGACWRRFLAKINMGYAAGKFGCDRWFDLDGTVKWMQRDIAERRKQGDCSNKAARKAWESVTSASNDCCDDSRVFQELLAHSDDWIDIWGGDWIDATSIRTDVDPCFRKFWDTTWQEFTRHILSELDQRAA